MYGVLTVKAKYSDETYEVTVLPAAVCNNNIIASIQLQFHLELNLGVLLQNFNDILKLLRKNSSISQSLWGMGCLWKILAPAAVKHHLDFILLLTFSSKKLWFSLGIQNHCPFCSFLCWYTLFITGFPSFLFFYPFSPQL